MKENYNLLMDSDSYKVGHWSMMPSNTEIVYSYFENRKGAKYDKTIFFGLQYILMEYLQGKVVDREKIEQAEELFKNHFGTDAYFNKSGWEYIVDKYDGKLPVVIKAVPEGLAIPTSNVLLTIENTDNKCYWLTNYLETLLSRLWYSCSVSTLSRNVKILENKYLDLTADNKNGLPFMLHDFGSRGVSSYESSQIGGAAHLINFVGTDTIAAMPFLIKYYSANPKTLAYSVAATEHSVMTSLGRDGEMEILNQLLTKYPGGILSVVSDSYDIENFVDNFIGNVFKSRIIERNGIFVTRPDSVRNETDTPEDQMLWIAESLWKNFGGTINSKGYRIINPKIRMLWGDGIDIDGIEKILKKLADNKFSVENIATFGMGGGLLQKINRDTQRFAFKSCWQQRDGIGYDIFKQPKDNSKISKKGRLKLVRVEGSHLSTYITVPETDSRPDELVEVFRNGEIKKYYTFDEIRANASCLL